MCSEPEAGWQRPEAVSRLVAEALADPETTWTMGGFGALARFGRRRDPFVAAPADGRPGHVTAFGGIALEPAAAIPVAYETAFTGGWSHAVALCLPGARCPRAGAGPIRDVGRDHGALRAQNRGDKWFDLGLDLPQGRLLLRSADPDTLAHLAVLAGRTVADTIEAVRGLMAAADVVVTTPLGRIEVFAGAPASSDGPRAFLDPKILGLGRTHAATAPIPSGLVPVAQFTPPHPCRDGAGRFRPFDPGAHATFQAVLSRWGDPELVRLKARLLAGDTVAPLAANRATRAVSRLVQVQMAAAANQDRAKSCTDTPR